MTRRPHLLRFLFLRSTPAPCPWHVPSKGPASTIRHSELMCSISASDGQLHFLRTSEKALDFMDSGSWICMESGGGGACRRFCANLSRHGIQTHSRLTEIKVCDLLCFEVTLRQIPSPAIPFRPVASRALRRPCQHLASEVTADPGWRSPCERIGNRPPEGVF